MKELFIAILILLSVKAGAQLYDAQWVIGLAPNISLMDFRNIDSVQVSKIQGTMQIFLTSANICNTYGNLLCFTNGIYIADSTGNMMLNGDSLNPCPYTYDYEGSGLNIQQAALFLPKPGNSSIYYLIHFSNDTDNGNLPGTLYYTQIRDSGLGYVIKKNIPFGKGIFRQGGISACKHANGRDYWVVMGLDGTNEYFKYLFMPDTILGPFAQNIGPLYGGPFDLPYSKFSQDGSKYVTGAGEGPVTVMDFDRCSGEFSNPDTLYNEGCPPPTPCSASTGVEFSPNGRFVYVSDVNNLNQYDLWSANVQDSVEVYFADSSDFSEIDFVQLAPNGKLYGCTYNGGFNFLHVVNYPDLKGDSCDFVWGGQPTLSDNSINLPNMINYNLGALAGPCDTITSIQEARTKKQEPRVMPNPTNKYLYVEMSSQGSYEFDLLNCLGQVVAVRETRQVDIFDTEGLASGVYLLRVIDRNNINAIITAKVVVVH